MKFASLIPSVPWILLSIIGTFSIQNFPLALADDNNSFLSTRVDMVGLAKQLLAPLGVMIKAAVKEANDNLPGQMMSGTEQIGTCCNVGDIGAKLNVELFEFELEEVDEEEQIEINTEPAAAEKSSSDSNRIIQVTTSGSDLRISAGLSMEVGFAAILPFSCDVSARAAVVLDRYAIDFELDLQDDNATFANFQMAEIDEGLARLEINPTLSGVCEAVEEPILKVFETISDQLTILFRNVFSKRMTELIKDQINVAIKLLLPPEGGIDIDLSLDDFLPGRSLTIMPRLDSLSTGLVSTDWQSSGSMKAFLAEPAWRDGSSFDYDDYVKLHNADTTPTSGMPEPDLEHVFNLRIGAPALNELFTTMYYLGWSKVAETEIDVTSSPLCEEKDSLATDPCPFPPSQRTVSFLNYEFYALFFMYPFNLFTGFDLQTQITPPALRFITDGMTGEGTVALAIRGRTLGAEEGTDLATVTTSYNAVGGLPGFDFETGRIKFIRLDELYLDDVEIEFTNAPILSSLTTLLATVATSILRGVSTLILGFVNDGLDKAINELPTLLIPDMEAFPIVSGIMNFYLPVGGMKAVAAESDGGVSYVDIWGDLGTRTLDTNDEDEEEERDEDYYKYESKNRCANVKQWAQESDNPMASFSCSTYANARSEKKQIDFEAGQK